MKIKSRKSLSLTGLRYDSDTQDFQTHCYFLITERGDLKYNLLYDLAAKGRIRLDGRLTTLIRTLVKEIRLRDEEIEELTAKVRKLESYRDDRCDESMIDDAVDEDGRLIGYYGV